MAEKEKTERKRATSVDVAKLAGVSQSTVSRVFNKKWEGSLGEDAKEKVLSAARELGYTPNAIGHILASQKSGILSVVVSRQWDMFYYNILRLMTNEIMDRGYKVMIVTSEPKDDVNEVVNQLLRYQVEGIIITSSVLAHKKFNGNVDKIGIPIVIYNGYVGDVGLNMVHSDNYGGSIMAADFLVDTGQTSFAYISTQKSIYGSLMERQEGFLYGLMRRGISRCQIVDGDYSYQSGYEIGNELFSQSDYPTGVLCEGDMNALGVIAAAKKKGLRVGQDVSIMGYEGPDVGSLDLYSLTTLTQQNELMVHDAVELILLQMEDEKRPSSIITRPMELIVRGSTAPLRK